MYSNPYFSQVVHIHSERGHVAEAIPTGVIPHKGTMLQAKTKKELCLRALLPSIVDNAFKEEL